MATLAEYYAGQGGAEDLDWTQRREIAQAGGNLRYNDLSQAPDDRYLKQITDYWGGSAAVPTKGGGYAVIDNSQVGAGGYRTVKNPLYEQAANLERAYKMADYISSFADPETTRAQVKALTGIDLGAINAPGQRKKETELQDLSIKKGQAGQANALAMKSRQELIDMAQRPEDLVAMGFDPQTADALFNRKRDEARIEAQRAGVPVAPELPRGVSRAARERMLQSDMKAAETKITDQAEAAKQSRDAALLAARFAAINEKTSSGGLGGTRPVAGVKGLFSSDVAEMQAITAKMVPLARQGFPGAASELDREMFRQAVPSIDKPRETNNNIVQAMRTAASLEADRLRFLDTYRSKNDGRLTGAEQAWQEYLNDNPVFDPKAQVAATTGQQHNFEPNLARMKWEDWFRTREAARQELQRRQRGR